MWLNKEGEGSGAAGGDSSKGGDGILFDDKSASGNSAGNTQAGGTSGAGGAGAAGVNDKSGAGDGQKIEIPSNWKDSLPEELKTLPFMGMVNDIPTLVKNYANAQKMVGADKVAIPGANASKEDWQGVFQKLGLPKTVEEYKVDVEKGKELDKEFMGSFAKLAHENGILPHQAKAMAEFLFNADKETRTKDEENYRLQTAGELKKLQGEWGEQYKENVAKAKAALREFADKDTQEAIRKSGLGNNTHLLKILAKMGDTLSEDKIKGEGGGGGFRLTPSQAQAELDTIHRDLKHPYYNASHSEHLVAKAKVRELYQMITPQNS
jgi:hypothetical protein